MIGLGLGSQPTTECGIFGSYQSLTLDGNSDYILLPDGFRENFPRTECTVSFWVNLVQNDGDTSQVILKVYSDSNDHFQLWYHKHHTEWRGTLKTDGDVYTTTYDIPGSGTNDGSGYDDGWQHFVISFKIEDANLTLKIYQNGDLKDTTSVTDGSVVAWDAGVTVATIGINQDLNQSFMDGHIDQLAIWSEQLSDTNVEAIYNGGKIRDLTTNHTNYSAEYLYAYYQMEGNALDSGKNSYHGTLNGTAGFATNQP